MKLQPLNKFRNQYRTYGLYDDYVLLFALDRALCAKHIIFHTEKVEEVRFMIIKIDLRGVYMELKRLYRHYNNVSY